MRKILHIGLHKTGITFLQKHVFPKIKGVQIISNESISGFPIMFGTNAKNLRNGMANVIRQLDPNVEILIVLREKEGWKKSIWKQYIKGGGIHGYEKFIKGFDSNYLDFSGYVAMLTEMFKTVHVVWYRRNTLAIDICRCLGVKIPDIKENPVNVSMTDKEAEMAMEINRTFNMPPKSRLSGRYIVKWLRKLNL
jgi:hypothetical protein